MTHQSLIGKQAPQFETMAVIDKAFKEDFSLDQYRGKYVILFFYPLDFTFVCPTELHAFQDRMEEFTMRNAQVVGCSVDSQYAHFAWLETPKSKGGIEGVKYPLISDLKKEISRDYGVLNEEEGIAYRGLFLIDKEGIVRHALINDLPIGRSVDELLRTLDAWIFHETHGDVCPANWHHGEKGMSADQAGLNSYFGT